MDWDNWWALENSAGPSIHMKYLDALRDYYSAAFGQNVPVDLVSVEDSIDKYKVVIALLLYMIKGDYDEKISSYKEDFYANTPVITKNFFGKGSEYYVGTRSNDEFYAAFLEDVFKEAGVKSVLTTPEGVEASVRRNEKGEVLFLLNHSKDEQEVTLEDNYLDLLDKDRICKGETIKLEKNGVRLLFHSTLTDVS